MRLVDTVMPSPSLLEEVKKRRAIEVGQEEANHLYKESRRSLRNSILNNDSNRKLSMLALKNNSFLSKSMRRSVDGPIMSGMSVASMSMD